MKSKLDINLVKSMYIDRHMSVLEVATELNVPASRVSSTLKRNGISKTHEQIVEDRKLHLLNEYGVSCSLQTNSAKQKSTETCLKKRGVEHHSKDPVVKAKKAHTCQEKYGVDHYAKTDEYLEKCKQTLSSKYGDGVAFPLQSEEIKAQKNRTMMEKYGTTSAVAIRWARYREEKERLAQAALNEEGK